MLSVTVFVGMATSIKLAGAVDAGQIVFYRSLFAIIPILILLAWRGELATGFRTNRPWGHILRGVIGVVSMWLGFAGLTRLPLPEQITLNYAQPLLVVVFGALILGEVVRFYRWSAVIVGFVGVVIVAWPKLTLLTGPQALESEQVIGVLAVLSGAVVSGFVMLQIRQLVETERSSTIVLWFSVICAVLGLATLPFGWTPLDRMQLVCLIMAGLAGGVGQILMTEAYRHGDVSIIAPFEYTSMLLAVVIGLAVFGDAPTLHMLAGGAIVVASGIFVVLRERQLGLDRAAARQATPP